VTALKEAEQQAQGLRTEGRQLREETDVLVRQLAAAQQEAEKWGHERDKLRSAVETEKKKAGEVEDLLDEARQEIEALKQRQTPSPDPELREDLVAESDRITEVEASLKKEMGKVEKLVTAVGQTVRDLEKAASSEADLSKHELERVAEREQQLVEELETLRGKLDEVAAGRQTKVNEAETLAAEVEQLKRQLEAKAADGETRPAGQPRGREDELARRLRLLEVTLSEKEKTIKARQQKVDELNLQLGDKDAEILVLHGSISDLKRRADVLLDKVREVSAQLPAISPDRLKEILEKVDSDLAGIVE
jgi:chromosome segregation ATPase